MALTDAGFEGAEWDEACWKESAAAHLATARRRTLALTDAVDEGDLLRQHSPLMSPLVWDLAHIGNYEELWLLRAAAGQPALRPEIDDIYDAFEHPRAERPNLPLLAPAQARTYLGEVRDRVLDALEQARPSARQPLLRQGFVYGLVVQHEHQHDETMLATHQLRQGAPVLTAAQPSTTSPPGENLPAETLVAAGPFVQGTSADPWAYDNERPAHVVDLPAYWIDTVPVSNADYLGFVESGGYADRRHWSTAGWAWRCAESLAAPAHVAEQLTHAVRRRAGGIAAHRRRLVVALT